MEDLQNRVAVITGAGSGLGRELANLCAGAGMLLALADVDEAGLAETMSLLPGSTPAFAMKVDVSRPEVVDAFRDRTYRTFGAAHLVFNNAGVAASGPVWSTTPDDWAWVLGVNVMGAVHGIRSFVPRMLESGEPGRIVNTASLAGLTSVPGFSVYCASKHSIVALSECLYHELAALRANVSVSVLCPAFFRTALADSERNRPREFANANPHAEEYEGMVRAAIAAGGLSATEVAQRAMDAIVAGDFYILPHRGGTRQVELRMRDIVERRYPTSRTGE